jgi:hypothetical protein
MMQSLNARALGARVAAVPQCRRGNACRAVTTATARVDRCSKNSVIVSPSILSANFAKLGEQVRKPAAGWVTPPDLPVPAAR